MKIARLHLLLLLFGSAVALRADWPQWRGPGRDGVVSPRSLSLKIESEKPAAAWRVAVGPGYASPVVANGRLVYLDATETEEVAHCLDATNGKAIWSKTYATRYEDEWGAGPRSTPMIDGGLVYVQSCNGVFACLSLADGTKVWSVDFDAAYGVKFVGSKANEGVARRRGNNGSGIVDGNAVIVPVGGVDNASLVAFDKLTGKELWRSGSDEAAYSSLLVAEVAGRRQIIHLNAEALVGVDRMTGKLLWRQPLKTNAKRHAATPVVFGNRVVVNSHTFGTLCFEINPGEGAFTVVEKWRNEEAKINLATPVLVDGNLYSQGPAKDFLCIDAPTGKTNWRDAGYGKEYSSILTGGKDLLVLTDQGELVVMKANPTQAEVSTRLQICGKNWSHPAVSGGLLFIRDSKELAAYKVEAK